MLSLRWCDLLEMNSPLPPPPPTPPHSLPSHSASPMYYLVTLTLSCYPVPFSSISHSSTLTRLKSGLSNPLRVLGGISFMSGCSEESPEWPCSTILLILSLFRLFGFFLFNVWTCCFYWSNGVNRGWKILISFLAEKEAKQNIFIANLNLDFLPSV